MNSRALAAALVLLATGPVRAQTPTAPGRTLDLDEALARAASMNPTLESARARLDVALEGVRQARAAFFPVLAAQGRYTHNHKEVEFNSPLGSIVIQKQEQLDAQLSATVPLVTPSAYFGVRAANRAHDAAEADLTLTRTAIVFAAGQAFFAAAGTDELVLARGHAVAVAQKTLDDAKVRLRTGTSTQVDVARAEIALVRAEQAAEEAADARAQTYRGLATVIQLREPFQVKPPQVLPAEGEVAPEVAVNRALELRPELISLRASIEALDAQAKAAGWRWAPTLSAFGLGRVFNYEGFSGDKYSWAAGLQLDWVLFDGSLRDAQRRAADAQRRATEARLRLERDNVSDEVANARQALATRKKALGAATRAVELARQTLDLVRVQYENGVATQLDLLQSQDALVLSEVGLAQARFDLALGGLTYLRVTGTLKPPKP